MSFSQTLLTIGLVMLGTLITRYLAFLLFPAGRSTPPYVQYLGKVLPAAVLGMLVIYCYKGVSLGGPLHGLPEFLAGAVVVLLQFWKKNLFLSLLAGTGLYMLLLALL